MTLHAICSNEKSNSFLFIQTLPSSTMRIVRDFIRARHFMHIYYMHLSFICQQSFAAGESRRLGNRYPFISCCL